MAEQQISDSKTRAAVLLVLTCFFLSGLSGLTYEILWTRMVVRIIGSAPFAVSIILTIFMGGLGLGSYLAGRFIDRIKEPLALVKVYGILELAIGAYAIAVPVLLTALSPLQAAFYRGLYSHFLLYNLLTFIVCLVLLCFPVICMGATLPILCRFYVASLSRLGTRAGRLYGLNTIGAALGSLACGFWLIDLWGVYGTLAFAVVVNLTIGLSCLAVSHRTKVALAGTVHETSGSGKAPAADETEDRHPSERVGALVIFVVSGFCAMACEVIWTRLLGVIVGPTTYSFTIVLVTFITGLALGSMIFGYFADRVKRCIWLLLLTQTAAALLVLVVSQLLGGSQMLFGKLIFSFREQFVLLSLLKAAVLFAFMILPTLCFGAAFPLVSKICTKSVSEVGSSIGFAYMLNTVGSLLGPFCAGFLLIPLAGKELGLGIVVSLQLITSLVVAAIMLKGKKESIRRFGCLAVPALVGLVLCFHYPAWDHLQLAIGKYHRLEKARGVTVNTGWMEALLRGPDILSRLEKRELVYYGDGIGGFTAVVKRTDALGNTRYVLANSGKPEASSRGDMITQTLAAHFPMLFHRNPETVMVLGLASGITAGEVLHYPVGKLDILEISDQVVGASRFFVPWNGGVLSDPRTNLIVQDGRAHLQLTEENYDVIVSEPSNPWMAGLAALFTRDYFSLARSRLNSDGIFVQWLHSYQMDWETFALVGRTFANVFPNSILVHSDPSRRAGDYLLVGFKGEERLNLAYGERKLKYMQKSGNVDLRDAKLLYRLIVSEDLHGLFGQGRLNTDSRPWLEFAAPKLMYRIGPEIAEKIGSHKDQGLTPLTASIVQQEADADSQIDLVIYALSTFTPYRDMLDLSRVTPSQRERFVKLMENYCASNEIDYGIFTDNELKQRVMSIQIAAMEDEIDHLPNRLASLSYLGDLHSMEGNASEAINYYEAALQLDPDSASIHSKLGIALAGQDRPDEATRHFSRALQASSGNAKSHYNLAFALAEEGKTGEAVNHYMEALRIYPEYTKAHYNLGVALAKLDRLDEAVSHYAEALRLDPGYAAAHNSMGTALGKQGHLERAITHFSQALQIDPGYAEAHYNLGVALGRQGKLVESVGHYREALRLDPGHSKAHYSLGVALAERGRLSDAINHFSEALRRDPGHAGTHHHMGVALAKQDRLDEAISHLSKALSINPEYAEAHNGLGIVLVRKGRIEDAAGHFRKALGIEPDFVLARRNLKRCLGILGKD